MLLDTSTIIEIFRNPPTSARFEKITKSIGDEEIYVSIVQFAEIADWAIKNKASPKERIQAVKELARTVPLDEDICEDAAEIKQKHRKFARSKFGLIDGIILATARSVGQRVLTFDEDFAGEKDCLVIQGEH